MRYHENYVGYELGNFLPPKYEGNENASIFFLLLQKPKRDPCAETFSVKLGKKRFLNDCFYADCLKVLVYFAVSGGRFDVYDINLDCKKDGTRYFDAAAFLDKQGIAFELSDTSGFKYFKNRLYECRRELILEEDGLKFFIIHRRINADDFEHLTAYYTENKILRQAYFLLERTSNPPGVDYCNINYFQSEGDLLRFIQDEFNGTDAEVVTTYSLSDLLKGQRYSTGHKQGTVKSESQILLVHDLNLSRLYRILDTANVIDDDGYKIYLSKYMKNIKSSNEISEIIDTFNDAQDNYW